MINTGADVNAAYMNFLRCVRAICTAAAGTSTLTVNPFTNNTGTIDSTRNCIVSIDANTEAGGWTESTASNVVQSGSFTAIASAAAGLYKFDCYNASNKGSLPYMKLSFHATTMSNLSGSIYGTLSNTTGITSGFATYPFMRVTYGASTTTDWSGTSYVPSDSYPNYSSQLTSWSLNMSSGGGGTPSNGHPAFWVNNPTVNYRMAVTSTYCIIWEVHTSNSYAVGYSQTFTTIPSSSIGSASYGSLIYCGLRETVLWENSRSDNPPWVAMKLSHVYYPYVTGASGSPYPSNEVAAYMATLNDSGIPSSTATRYYLCSSYNQENVMWNATTYTPMSQPYSSGGSTSSTSVNYIGLQTPLFWGRDSYNTIPTAGHQYMPTVDAATGTGVPSAYPIVVRRQASGTWNPGGAIRGMYKSLGMPFATMKNYFSAGQTYSIYNSVLGVTDTYIPVVFNETMYLIRYA